MDRDETVVDTVDRLERAVSRLERIVNGDAELSSPGLLVQHQQMMRDVEELKVHKPNAIQWAAGYLVLIAALGVASERMQEAFSIPHAMAMVLMLALLVIALIFFMGGLGFTRWTG